MVLRFNEHAIEVICGEGGVPHDEFLKWLPLPLPPVEWMLAKPGYMPPIPEGGGTKCHTNCVIVRTVFWHHSGLLQSGPDLYVLPSFSSHFVICFHCSLLWTILLS